MELYMGLIYELKRIFYGADCNNWAGMCHHGGEGYQDDEQGIGGINSGWIKRRFKKSHCRNC